MIAGCPKVRRALHAFGDRKTGDEQMSRKNTIYVTATITTILGIVGIAYIGSRGPAENLRDGDGVVPPVVERPAPTLPSLRLADHLDALKLDSSASASRVTVGTQVELQFTITNSGSQSLILDLQQHSAQLVVRLSVVKCEPLAYERVIERTITQVIDRRIECRPGESESFIAVVDTGLDFPERDAFRRYHASASLSFESKVAGEKKFVDELYFEPVTLRVVPAYHAKFLALPLPSFHRSIDEGTANDVFICAMLLEGKEQDEAAKALIDLLPSINETAIAITCYILQQMTGESFGVDAEKWRQWANRKG